MRVYISVEPLGTALAAGLPSRDRVLDAFHCSVVGEAETGAAVTEKFATRPNGSRR